MTFLGANGFGYSAKDCLRLAKNSGKPYKLIGITDYQCYGSLLEAPQSKPLPSEKCLGQRGYGNSVGLYKVLKTLGSEEFKSLGCWADKRMLGSGPERALEDLLKYKDYGISAQECLDIVLKENEKKKAKEEKPYVYFGVQVSTEKCKFLCLFSFDTYLKANIHSGWAGMLGDCKNRSVRQLQKIWTFG